MSTEEIFDWANEHWTPYQDQSEDHVYSPDGECQPVTRDVFIYLEELFRLDITKVDFPELLNYLQTPRGQYEEGRHKLSCYFKSVD